MEPIRRYIRLLISLYIKSARHLWDFFFSSAAAFSSSSSLITASTSSSLKIYTPSFAFITAISIIFEEGSTVSNNAYTTALTVPIPSVSCQCFSKNSLTVLEFRPIALAFHAEKVPEGSVWKRYGVFGGSKPMISVEMPKGRTPPDYVYFCCTPAMYRVSCSTEMGSSYVNL